MSKIGPPNWWLLHKMVDLTNKTLEIVVEGDNSIRELILNGNNTLLGNTYYNLDVSGTTLLQSTLDVNEATTLHSTLYVSGATSLGSTLNVSGATILHELNVTGETTLHDGLNVSGITTLNGPTFLWDNLNVVERTTLNTLNVTGATSLQSTLDVTGATTLNNTYLATGDLYVNQNKIYFGDNSYFHSRNNGHMSLHLGSDDTNFEILRGNSLSLFTVRNYGEDNKIVLSMATSLQSTLDVTGATTLHSTLDVTGATTLHNTLYVDNIKSTSNIITLNNKVVVEGDFQVTTGNTISVSKEVITVTQNTIRLNANISNSNLIKTPKSGLVIETVENEDGYLLWDRTDRYWDLSGDNLKGNALKFSSLDVTGATSLHSSLNVHENITGNNLSAQTFGPTYTTFPDLHGKIGQIKDAGLQSKTLVYNNSIEVRSLTIPYTGVWAIDMALFLGNIGNLSTDIKFPTSININGAVTQNFYGTNITGVNGSIKRKLSQNDVVTFHTFLTGTGASGLTASQRVVWGNGYTFLTATRIA